MNSTLKQTKKPKLLYLVHRFPYPPNRGDRIRAFHLLKFLVRRYDVYLATLWDEPPAASELRVLRKMCAEVVALPIGKRTRWLKAAVSVAIGKSATEGLFHSRKLANQVNRWIKSNKFEVGLVYCSSMVQYVVNAPEIDLVVDLVDVDSQKWLDYATTSRGWKKWLFQLEAKRLRRVETALPDRCKAITLVSDAEADLFREICPNDRTFGICNGVDLDYFTRHEPEEQSRLPKRKQIMDRDSISSNARLTTSCVFVGALDYRANIQGLEWFCENCWPAIREQRPEATLELVGRNPGLAARKLAELPGVGLVGQVPDVRPYIRRSKIVVVPLLVARGIQNKVLEALAMQKAVVASPQAIKGIVCRSGRHLLRAANSGDWVRHIVSLLENQERRNSLGAAGRCLVKENFSWSSRLGKLDSILSVEKVPADDLDFTREYEHNFQNPNLLDARAKAS